jgi:hypothetical protein
MAAQENTKIGSGHFRGMMKQGLAELRAAMYPESNVAQPTELGIFGRETPGEVAMSREGLDAEQEPRSALDERLAAADARREVGAERGEKGREPERG